MLSGYINLFGVAFTLCSIVSFTWRWRIAKYSPDSQIKDLWLKILFYIGVYVFFMGNALWIDDPVWFRANLIIAHVIMIPALYYISKAWWKLLIKEMPKWWGWLIVGLGLVYVGAETFYAFQGYLPYSEVIRDNLTVMVRNDHPLVAWLFIPTVWLAFWPMGFVFFRQSMQAKELKLKLRLLVFGLAWILGSSMTVYSNFVTEPARVYSGNLLLIVVFTLMLPAAFLKPKNAGTTATSAA